MDLKEASIRARNLITERSEGSVDIALPRIRAMVPTCLESWTRKCFADREKRELFKTAFEATLVDGSLDLATFLDGTDGRINLKELRQTSIYLDSEPFTWVNSQQQLATSRPVGGDAPACFLDGSVLKTRTAGGAFDSAAEVTFTVTSYPAAITDISKNLEHDFIEYLAGTVMQQK